MKYTHVLGAAMLSLVLVGAGCGGAASTGSSQSAVSDTGAAPAAPAAAPAPAASFADTVSAKLTAGSFNFSKSDLGTKLDALGITNNVTAGTKFSVLGNAGTIQITVLDLKTGNDGPAVVAALNNNFAAVKQASAKYVTKILGIGAPGAVVGFVYHMDDAAIAAQVEAALNK